MSGLNQRSAPRRSRKTAKPAPPCTMVIFGANGDLTKRLLMPALYNLSGAKLLDDKFAILGVDRDAGTRWRLPGPAEDHDGELHTGQPEGSSPRRA